MRRFLLAAGILAFVVSGVTLGAQVCPDNHADVDGTYVRKNSQGVIQARFRVTGHKAFVKLEKLDLEDGSVIMSGTGVWTNAAPLCFAAANKNTERLIVYTRGTTPPFNLNLQTFDKDCNLIRSTTWEKESP